MVNIVNEQKGKRVAILGASPTSNNGGGAERFYEGLSSGFQNIGCSVEFISVIADEPSYESIVGNYRRVRDLDLTSFDLVISTKAPTYAVIHPRHVVYLVHTIRVFDDMFEEAFRNPSDELFAQRAHIHDMDFKGLSGAVKIFAIGHEVAGRLYRWHGLDAQVIHPPLAFNKFKCESQGDYFFLPGRLHPWKRVDLAIQAVRQSTLPLKLVIAGEGEAEPTLRTLASGDPRITFLGRVDDADLIDRYGHALAVIFVPLREDYGYVTLEAFAAHKPVITCVDSGEPTQLVRDGENGLICEANAAALQASMERIYSDRVGASHMGDNGAAQIAGMSWESVAQELYDAGFGGSAAVRPERTTAVTVLDMQPIDPPIGGGRLRLLGLYHALGSHMPSTYVGSYDWPGEAYRNHALSSTLQEIDVPLSDVHHKAASKLSERASGKTVIDIAFSRQGMLSPAYLKTARGQMRDADILVFSHPWVFPLVRDDIAPHQTIIYDSHNVEGFLRAQLLNEAVEAEAQLLREVVDAELELCKRADLVLACSQEDLLRFNRIYHVPGSKLRVVPNGVMAFSHHPSSSDERKLARESVDVPASALVAFFIGSAYMPNVEAARFIANTLAPSIPGVLFVIGGGVGARIHSGRPNVRITGVLSDDQRKQWLAASDIAINPMFSGSGTNIKMFDFMAMGLPVIATQIGARGIECGGRTHDAITIVDGTAAAFRAAIDELREEATRVERGKQVRLCVEDGYAWERISPLCGQMFSNCRRFAGQSRPLFSVVIPTYERHDQLDSVMECLTAQVERDFEVVVNDQSTMRWSGSDKCWGFPLTYYHSPVKGAIRARNVGAALAQGNIIAFTDDDCMPKPDWLLKARRHFLKDKIVGLEGMIVSDHLNDPEWRPVTNVGFEGIGFMTANLMIRSECFQLLGGFDLQFDYPHFREDTDLGWRLQELGPVPYASDVVVVHPAQPRSLARESSIERAKFFKKDAILFKKHKNKYRILFEREAHWKGTPGFRENLEAGFEELRIDIPDWMQKRLS